MPGNSTTQNVNRVFLNIQTPHDNCGSRVVVFFLPSGLGHGGCIILPDLSPGEGYLLGMFSLQTVVEIVVCGKTPVKLAMHI